MVGIATYNCFKTRTLLRLNVHVHVPVSRMFTHAHIAKTCSPLSTSHGRINSSDTRYPAAVHVSCDDGYHAGGSQEYDVTCGADAAWRFDDGTLSADDLCRRKSSPFSFVIMFVTKVCGVGSGGQGASSINCVLFSHDQILYDVKNYG